MNGNIALSMEIGSAYALQVCLLQIPALVAWSAYSMGSFPRDKILTHTFTWVNYLVVPSNKTDLCSLIFPQWDLVTVILCVFLLSYIYAEGKSNYFKVNRYIHRISYELMLWKRGQSWFSVTSPLCSDSFSVLTRTYPSEQGQKSVVTDQEQMATVSMSKLR